jgi:branched-subunit amino acid transport protein AzlD
MKTGNGEAMLLTLVMGAVIFLCRAIPFLFFQRKENSPGIAKNKSFRKAAFLSFVEKTVPPTAMTVLCFNALAASIHDNIREALPVLAAAAFTAFVHLWRRNPLISIFGGTAVYMVLERMIF